MKIVNLTPHPVTLVSASGVETVIAPEPNPVRVASTPGVCLDEEAAALGPVALYSASTWGEVEGLPEPQPGTIYVVSGVVADRCPGREDVFHPATGPADGALRDESGRVRAVTRLKQAPGC